MTMEGGVIGDDRSVLGLANENDPYGYLLVHFREDPNGYAERIYFDLSDGDDPTRWVPLNRGKPVLTSSIGTTGVRDPHITQNPETGTYYIIATDLRVFGGRPDDGANWYDWSHRGSTCLIVWESDDLVSWRGPRMLDMARPVNRETPLELGQAWACECLWVPDYYPVGHQGGRGAFVMYWSSKLFSPDDHDHTEKSVHDTVLWGVTTDFSQEMYEYGGVFIDTGGDSIDTTMIQRPVGTGDSDAGATLRTYRITKDNTFGRGIWMDATDAPDWWEPDTPWRTIQTNIGDGYSDGHGLEGPAVFAGHGGNADRWYLLVDVIPSVGYRPMVSDDLDVGWKLLGDAGFGLAPHTKHGGVLTLTRNSYECLRSGFPAI